jgi:WD40 repeat protein
MAVQVERIHTLSGHSDCVYALQPGQEPHLFFSGGGDGIVALWDLTNPNVAQQIARLPNSVYALHYHSETNLLVAGHNYEGIHLLDWQEKKELRSLKISAAAIFDIQSFGNTLFVATGDGVVTVVDLESWTIRKKLMHSEKSARVIVVNPILGELSVGYSDHSIRVFDIPDFVLKKEWVAHQNSVFTIGYTSDFKLLISGSRDAKLKAWDVTNNYTQVGEVAAHLYAINHIVFSPDGNHFATSSMDKSIKIWNTAELRLLKVIDKARHAGHGTSVNKLLWTSFNNQLISGSDDRSISVWDIAIGQD